MEARLFTRLHIYASACIIMRMADYKERRQRAIAELIRGNTLSSQEELADRLGSLGFAVTQATISRDLEQLGAVKVRRQGQLGYALPDIAGAGFSPRVASVFRDWVRSVQPAANLVVDRHISSGWRSTIRRSTRSSVRSAATTRSSSPAARRVRRSRCRRSSAAIYSVAIFVGMQ